MKITNWKTNEIIFEDNNVSFAFPSQSIYIEKNEKFNNS